MLVPPPVIFYVSLNTKLSQSKNLFSLFHISVPHSIIQLVLLTFYLQNIFRIIPSSYPHNCNFFWITCLLTTCYLIFPQFFHICSSRLVPIYARFQWHVLCEYFTTFKDKVNVYFFHFTMAYSISITIITHMLISSVGRLYS